MFAQCLHGLSVGTSASSLSLKTCMFYLSVIFIGMGLCGSVIQLKQVQLMDGQTGLRVVMSERHKLGCQTIKYFIHLFTKTIIKARMYPFWSCVLFDLQSSNHWILWLLSVKYFLGVVNCFTLFHPFSLTHCHFAVLKSLVQAQNKACRYKYHQQLRVLWLRPAVEMAVFVET